MKATTGSSPRGQRDVWTCISFNIRRRSNLWANFLDQFQRTVNTVLEHSIMFALFTLWAFLCYKSQIHISKLNRNTSEHFHSTFSRSGNFSLVTKLRTDSCEAHVFRKRKVFKGSWLSVYECPAR